MSGGECVRVCPYIRSTLKVWQQSDSETPTHLPKSAHISKYLLKETGREKEG